MAIEQLPRSYFGRKYVLARFILNRGSPIGHIGSLRQSSLIQNSFPLLKISFVLILIGMAFFSSNIEFNSLDFSSNGTKKVTKPGFAVSIILSFYAFTGLEFPGRLTMSKKSNQRQKKPPKSIDPVRPFL